MSTTDAEPGVRSGAMRWILLLTASMLVLAGCSSSEEDRPAAEAPQTTPAVSELAETADALCTLYCTELQELSSQCPTDATNLIVCSQPLARAKDVLNDVEARLLAVEPALDDKAPELEEALEDTFEFYEDWSVTPSGQMTCSMMNDTSSPIFPAPMRGRCTSAAASMSGFLPYIAEQLQVTAEG